MGHSPFTIHYSLFSWLSAALLLGLFYLAFSAWGFGFSGFPLDDAWIHQTYARNLARSGQLAFVPGLPSAGSTAPLWSVLLSLGYLLGLPFKLWTYGLGILLLGLTGWTMTRLGAVLFPEQPRLGGWAGLFCLLEWHLLWAAVSGMETMLFVWLSLLLVERYLVSHPLRNTNKTKYSSPAPLSSRFTLFGLGLLSGLLILTRPEGLGLIGLIGLDMAYHSFENKRKRQGAQGKINLSAISSWFPLIQRWFCLAAGVLLLLAPYIAFHLWATGLPFPNTFYAKQAEYQAILEHFSLWQRLFGPLGQPVETAQGVFRVIFIGAQLLLLPGLFFAAWLTFKERRTDLLLLWAWWLGFLLLYALRLPVTYQHGRYQIPALPWLILLGLWGMARLLEKIPRRSVALRALRRVWILSLGVLLLAFTVIGAQAYGRDVRFIESEMVVTARWLAAQTAPDALIAAHDIGAIGYFAQRPLIDLAGLITPEVIPIIRDEAALLDFVTTRRANYLVTFPSWYPSLVNSSKLTPLYITHSPWSPQAGGDNMTVYQVIP